MAKLIYRRTFKRDTVVASNLPVQTMVVSALQYGGEMTAYAVARCINALGSTVSSRMHKMMLAGIIKDTGRRSPRGGAIYTI